MTYCEANFHKAIFHQLLDLYPYLCEHFCSDELLYRSAIGIAYQHQPSVGREQGFESPVSASAFFSAYPKKS